MASRSAIGGHQRGARVPISIDPSYSSPQAPAPFHNGAPYPAVSFPSELSRNRPPSSHRRLPIPPVHVSDSPSASTSSSSLPLPTQLPTSQRQSVFVALGVCCNADPYRDSFCSSYRPLPKKPGSAAELLEPREGHACISGRSLPMAPQQHPTNIEKTRLRELSRPRLHLEGSVPSDLIAPRVDGEEASGSRIDGVRGDHSKAPIPAERLPTKEKMGKDGMDENLAKSHWLLEKNGKRWVEGNYDTIVQSLREL
jgi:hypothetical protein